MYLVRSNNKFLLSSNLVYVVLITGVNVAYVTSELHLAMPSACGREGVSLLVDRSPLGR